MKKNCFCCQGLIRLYLEELFEEYSLKRALKAVETDATKTWRLFGVALFKYFEAEKVKIAQVINSKVNV